MLARIAYDAEETAKARLCMRMFMDAFIGIVQQLQ